MPKQHRLFDRKLSPAGSMRRSLALPHRAMRSSSVNWFHAIIGIAVFADVAGLAFLYRFQIWRWQMAEWAAVAQRLGVNTVVSDQWFGWDQYFFMATWVDVLLLGTALLLITWLILRSSLIPLVKGAFVLLTTPLFLYSLVVFINGEPPVGALNHVGPEWLYGELVLWCLIPVLYAVFVFPIPMSLLVKLFSMVTVLSMSVAWRTFTPVLYMVIAVHSQGMLAIQAWMALGPWADYMYIIPVFSATLILYKGGRARDYRT